MPSSPVNRTFNLALWTLALAFALPLSTLGLTLSVLLQLVRPSPTQTPSLPLLLLLLPASRKIWNANGSDLELGCLICKGSRQDPTSNGIASAVDIGNADDGLAGHERRSQSCCSPSCYFQSKSLLQCESLPRVEALGSLADERRIWGEGGQMGSSKLEDVPELAESDHASEDDGGGPDTALAGIQGRRRLDADLKLVSALEIVVSCPKSDFRRVSYPRFRLEDELDPRHWPNPSSRKSSLVSSQGTTFLQGD